MKRGLPSWPRAVAATLIFGAVGYMPGASQQQAASNGEKFKVLVPILERAQDARGNFGKDVAEELRKLIERMPRHEAVDRKAMQEAMRKFGLKEDEMDCIKNMQLAVQMGAELVLCGRFTGASGSYRLDSVQVISSKTQEAFKLQQITAPGPKEAAAQIFTQFERWVGALGQAAFCYEYLGSNEWDRAIANCDEVLKVNPNSPRANMGKAFALYSKAIATTPPDPALLGQSLDLYKKVIATSQTPEQDALRMAGIIAARVGKQEDSRNYFRQYLELNPGDAEVRIQIANEQSKAGDHVGALRVVEEGLKADSTSVGLLTFAGIYAAQAAFKTNDEKGSKPGELVPEAQALYETAAKYYKKLFDLKNGDVEAAIPPQMIQTLVVLNRAQEAVEIGRRAVANPQTSTALTLAAYGGALANTGNTAEALRAFDAAIAKNDTSVKGLHGRKADVLLRSGDLQGSMGAFRAGIAAGDQKPDEVSNLIWAVGYTEKFQAKSYEAFLTYIDAARQFAESETEKSKLNYFGGITYFYIGSAIDGSKAASARRARPHFVRALELLDGAGPYARANPDVNLSKTVSDVRKYLEYLDAVIKRGV
ncbi:MAG: tetratricopeptide repeat protein [Longimicrobiales bacterium]